MSQWSPQRICVFCGSARCKRPESAETAIATGRLLAARGIYARRGFKMVKSESYTGFGGHPLVGETWELRL